MKLLMIFADRFAYRTSLKNWEDAPDQNVENELSDVIVAFIQGEAGDVEREKSVREKLVKNLKWLSGKLETRRVVLHSFAHLSESKAPPEFVMELFDKVQAKLENAGYEVHQTPFGYFLDLEMRAPGFSLARVFKNL